LGRLERVLARGLAATADLWPPIRTAYRWVHQAAHLLANPEQQRVEYLRRTYRGLLAEMARERAAAGPLAPAVRQFLKVTTSYWPGLFQCYEVAGLPRTNNDLEHFFGAARHHERRATGRKGAAPGMVLRGPVRLLTAVATRTQPIGAAELRPADPRAWRDLRRELQQRQHARQAQTRFRRDPAAYLAALEATLLPLTLPP
jgi:hypothetical protein